MTNFATFIDTANDKAPIAQRGKAKQKRTDLRLVGLGPGGHPRRRDPAALPRLPRQPARRHPVPHHDRRTGRPHTGDLAAASRRRPAATRDDGGVRRRAELSDANFAHLAATGLHFVGSVPPSDCPDLLALPAPPATPVDAGPLPRADRHRHPPHRLRHQPARRAHPLADPARRPVPRPRPDPGQGRRATRRPGRHPRPRQHPPRPATRSTRRDHRHHQRHLGRRVVTWDTDRRHPRRAPAQTWTIDHHRPHRSWKTSCSANAS